MNSNRIKYILLTIWLVGFLFCLSIALYAYNDIPKSFGNLLNQVIDTFTPQLATMLTFIFSDQLTKAKPKEINKIGAIFAILISIIYISIFCIFMLNFQNEKYTAPQVIDLFGSVRPKISFLVTALMAYYFAIKK
jgi:hypothetical protein